MTYESDKNKSFLRIQSIQVRTGNHQNLKKMNVT